MLNDLRYAFRALRRNPGFACTAILSIALGIGANSSIFSFADGLVLRPLPVPNASEVVNLRSRAPNASSVSFTGSTFENVSYPDLVDFRNNTKSFSGLAAYRDEQVGFAADPQKQSKLEGGFLVTGNFFSLLQVAPQIGRGFQPEEDAVPGRDAVMVLGNDFWKREFGGTPSVIGRHVRINGLDFTVIGVAPESFPGVDHVFRPAFYIPLMMAPKLHVSNEGLLTDRSRRVLMVKGRLKPGVSLQWADAEVAGIAKNLDQSYPATNHAFGAAVRTELQTTMDTYPFFVPVLGQMFVIVMLALAIACANVANLMLSRGRSRVREIAVRLAIGASRSRLVRQLMAESLLIALAGGGLGLLVANYAIHVFQFEIPSDMPLQYGFQLDHRVLWFTVLVSVGSAILFGLVPAFQSTRTDLVHTMKAGESEEARRRIFGRSALVVVQIAGSLLLLVAAAQLHRGTIRAVSEDPGFRKDHLLLMRFDPTVVGYSKSQAEQFYKTLVEESQRVPGVQSAALSFSIPFMYNFDLATVVPEGHQFGKGEESVRVTSSAVDANFFTTFGVPILRGRGFLPSDRAGAARVAVVNEAFARRYLGENPIGKRIQIKDDNDIWVEVVGVSVTSKQVAMFEPDLDFLYLPFSQNPHSRMTLIVESYGDPASLAAPMRAMAGSIDPKVPVFGVRTMENLFAESGVKQMSLSTAVVNFSSLIGLGLALAGLYAVMAYQAARRTREIGIRMALGANRLQVMKMILRQAATMGVAGVSIGMVLSYALSRAIGPVLKITVFDPTAFVLVPLGLMLTAFLAAAIPARRAARVEPLHALRQD